MIYDGGDSLDYGDFVFKYGKFCLIMIIILGFFCGDFL